MNHSADEYGRLGGFVHVNTAECRFSLMKRAVFGTHHSISEAHLPRYLAEWDFKWNTRKMTDGEMGNVRQLPLRVSRASVSRTGRLTTPLTHKQKARAFLHWRKQKDTQK